MALDLPTLPPGETDTYKIVDRVRQIIAYLMAGQLRFPATQNPSSDVNVLDDYEEGNWTPVLTFATPGDLAVVYSTQVGHYTKIGRLVNAGFTLVLSTFTHTTASGALTITGLPFPVNSALSSVAVSTWQGITKAGTNFNMLAGATTSTLVGRMSGSGLATAVVNAADMPTGGTPIFAGNVWYEV